MAIDELVHRIRELEEKLDQAIDERRQLFSYEVRKRRVRFEQAVRQRHRQLKTGIFRYLFRSGFLSVLFAPMVYVLILPLVILDIFVSLYQFICFPVYGIEKVKRSDFIVIDRHQLSYLNAIEKLNCVYCGYANGLLAYSRMIAGQSEAHFCPIKHARRSRGQHGHYWLFSEYGDAEGLSDKWRDVAKKSESRRGRYWFGSGED